MINMLLPVLILALLAEPTPLRAPEVGHPSDTRVASLCNPDEQVYFSCRTTSRGRFVSLCASRVLTTSAGHLVYRFGRPGRIELEFPPQQVGSQQRFAFAHYFRYQVDRTEIRFENAGHAYTIFDYYEGDLGQPEQTRGVSVAQVGKDQELRQILCKDSAVSRLVELEDVVPCDPQSALNMGACTK